MNDSNPYNALNPRQPGSIVHGWRTYVLVAPFRIVDAVAGITEGPFYGHEDDETHVYMPNLEFLVGATDAPSAMHRLDIRGNERVVFEDNGRIGRIVTFEPTTSK